MRPSLILLSVFHFLTFLVAAHPFIIISTKVEVHHVKPTHILQHRQGLLDQFESVVNSALGINTATSSSSAKSPGKATLASTHSTSSTKAVQTLAPPITASATSTSSSRGPQSTSTSSDDDDDTTSTISDQPTSTDSSSTTTTTDPSTSATSTSTTISQTVQPSPTSSLTNVQPTNTALPNKSDSNKNSVPAAGIAVAVIMIIAISLISAYLVFKYNSRAQAWWAARQEEKRQQRSYREALDGPASGSSSLRKEALADAASKRRTMLQSFFAPATAKLGHGAEIKRKPVNWGAKSSTAITSDTTDSEKISFTASAAPMGRIERYSGRHFAAELDSTPVFPAPVQPVSPISLGRKESLRNLPPVSPLCMHAELPAISEGQAAKDLPELPSVPALPSVLHAKKGKDGVFRLG